MKIAAKRVNIIYVMYNEIHLEIIYSFNLKNCEAGKLNSKDKNEKRAGTSFEQEKFM